METDNQINETNASVETGHLEEQVSKRSVEKRVRQRNKMVKETPGNSNLEQSVSVSTRHVEKLRKRSHLNRNRKNKERPGSIPLNKAPPGCRFERKNEINPKSNKFSHNLRLLLSSNNLNCLNGNTLNTIYALGHHPLFGESQMQAYKSPTTSNDLHFTTVVHKLSIFFITPLLCQC